MEYVWQLQGANHAIWCHIRHRCQIAFVCHLYMYCRGTATELTSYIFSYTKDFWLFYGINTELFQCGSELKAKFPIAIPWKFSAKINVREKKFELDFPPCKKEIEIISVRYVLRMFIDLNLETIHME